MDREKLFREVVDDNRHRIFRICSHYFPDPDDRNDAFQEAMIRIWDQISSLSIQDPRLCKRTK